PGYELFCFRRQVRSACHDRRWRMSLSRANVATAYNNAVPTFGLERRPFSSRIEKPACGGVDNAENRLAGFDERDVDGEIGPAIDEFARPIKRIDQKEPFIAAGRQNASRRFFFRDAGHPGKADAQSLEDDALGIAISIRHR